MGSPKVSHALLALLFLIAGTRLYGQPRPTFPIAYISVQRILSESVGAKAAAKELEALRNARAQDLTARKQAVEATKLQLANAGGFFSGSKRAELTELLKRQEAELQRATQQAQTDFTDLQKKMQDRLRIELTSIVTTLSSQRGVVYVLNQDTSIVLAPAAANWTEDVLQRLNAMDAEKAGGGNSGAQKPPAKTP